MSVSLHFAGMKPVFLEIDNFMSPTEMLFTKRERIGMTNPEKLVHDLAIDNKIPAVSLLKIHSLRNFHRKRSFHNEIFLNYSLNYKNGHFYSRFYNYFYYPNNHSQKTISGTLEFLIH